MRKGRSWPEMFSSATSRKSLILRIWFAVCSSEMASLAGWRQPTFLRVPITLLRCPMQSGRRKSSCSSSPNSRRNQSGPKKSLTSPSTQRNPSCRLRSRNATSSRRSISTWATCSATTCSKTCRLVSKSSFATSRRSPVLMRNPSTSPKIRCKHCERGLPSRKPKSSFPSSSRAQLWWLRPSQRSCCFRVVATMLRPARRSARVPHLPSAWLLKCTHRKSALTWMRALSIRTRTSRRPAAIPSR